MELQSYISILSEYKASWIINRALYCIKLKVLNYCPAVESFFEKNISVKRTELLDFEISELKKCIQGLGKKEKKKIIETADHAIEGKIWSFSNLYLDYKKPICWNYSPITKYNIDIKLKWYQIPDFHPVHGDIKIIWEASRFTHFYAFARAYILTENKKYYIAFSEQLSNWLQENPYGYGANYKCGQECALRMINALMVYSMFRKYNLTTNLDEQNIKELIERCYKKILANFFYAHKCIKNNHTLSELCGMIVGAWCCDDERQLKKAYLWLNKEIEQQFFADGGYKQYSFTYQRFALQLMEFIFKISSVTRWGLKKENQDRIAASAELLYCFQRKNGDVPNYGSNDGALIFPVTSCSYRDFTPVINGILRLTKGNDVYNKGIHDEEYIWFLPNKEIKSEGKSIKIRNKFPDTGYYLFHHAGSVMSINMQDYHSRPAHMDQLHIDLWVKDVNVLCDLGSYSYADSLGQQFILTGSHNTVKVEELEQMKKRGPFFIYGWSKGRLLKFDKTEFSGEICSKNHYIHRRTVRIIQKGYVIEDKLKNANEYKVIFHTPCEVKRNGEEIELLWEKVPIISIVNKDAYEIQIRPCYRSLFYLQKEQIWEVCFKQKGDASKTMLILKGE